MRTMTPRELEEFRALRATIRERGTARIYIFAAGLVAWAGVVLATVATMSLPIATLLPLLVLGGIFEAILALHIGVERVGRYLEVYFEGVEDGGSARWEQAAMAFGAGAAKGTPSPIFSSTFLMATLTNFVPSVLAGALPVEYAVVGTVHLLFVMRVLTAKKLVGAQRANDKARFEAMRTSDRERRASEPGAPPRPEA